MECKKIRDHYFQSADIKELESRIIDPAKLLFKCEGGDFPGGLVVKTSPFNAGVWVHYLIGVLRSHMPHSQKTKT